MKGLRVAELAERAGVAASTVRFYERAGLISPARRAHNGYRMFDESTLDELKFVQRAKGIGMSLEDIADLVAAWPTGKCQSLQARLRAYVARRISEVHQQRAELGAFEHQLQTVLSRLSAHDPGPAQCGRGCCCETDLDPAADQAAPGPAPDGCSLDHDALAARISQWQEVAAAAAWVEHTGASVRLALPADPGMTATVAGLCAAETACCPQVQFGLEVTASQVILTIGAPPGDGLLRMLLPDDALIRRGSGAGGMKAPSRAPASVTTAPSCSPIPRSAAMPPASQPPPSPGRTASGQSLTSSRHRTTANRPAQPWR